MEKEYDWEKLEENEKRIKTEIYILEKWMHILLFHL